MPIRAFNRSRAVARRIRTAVYLPACITRKMKKPHSRRTLRGLSTVTRVPSTREIIDMISCISFRLLLSCTLPLFSDGIPRACVRDILTILSA